jgi:RNA polymerase sigma-70 factor (ECF subfamily)
LKFFSGKKDNANKKLVEQIVLENYNRYYRMAYRYVHNEADACDIVQNGACMALKSSHTLKNPEYAGTWVYRIMINECFRFLKQPGHFSYEDMCEKNCLRTDGREDSYTDIDLRRAVDALGDRDKAIIILRYFEDRKLEEIADILGESVNTVKSRLYRCMKKLRGTLSDGDGQSELNFSNGMGG